jgi:hypothetical protein
MFFFLSRIAEAMEKPIRPNEGRTDAQKARHNLEAASALGVQHFHRANNFSNERLCQLFAAVVFSTHTGFADDMMHGKDGASRDGGGLDSDSREERAFRMWINSCGIPGVFLNNLFLDCRDGLALLKVEDYIEKGVVNWRKVEMKPNNKFKCVGNCGYAVNIGEPDILISDHHRMSVKMNVFCAGKDKPLNFSLVSIDGADIYDGNEKLILALVWQLMRFHVLKQLMVEICLVHRVRSFVKQTLCFLGPWWRQSAGRHCYHEMGQCKDIWKKTRQVYHISHAILSRQRIE